VVVDLITTPFEPVTDTGDLITTMTKEGAVVSTLAGNGEKGLSDGQVPNVRYSKPYSVVVAAIDHFLVSDFGSVW